MFSPGPNARKGALSCAAFACALLNLGARSGFADDTRLPMPPMAGPLTSNESPTKFDAGPFGSVFITGALTGFGQLQTNATPDDRDAEMGLTNAQVFVQKTDGALQFFIQGGGYSLPALGTPYVD